MREGEEASSSWQLSSPIPDASGCFFGSCRGIYCRCVAGVAWENMPWCVRAHVGVVPEATVCQPFVIHAHLIHEERFMKRRIAICCLTFCIAAVPAFAGGIVSLDLTSSSAGANYRGPVPADVDWTLSATVSGGDNMGLACFLVDLVQDPANPDPVILTPASTIPPEMTDFDRPNGIANPAGYAGIQVDVGPGAKNVIQIGGAQNNFGALPNPPVPGLAEDFIVNPHIGQSPGGQVLASGSFSPPAALGVYQFSISPGEANTFDSINEPPKWSSVSAATVQMGDTGGSFSFVLCLASDADGSMDLTLNDITTLVNLLLGSTSADAYATCAVDLNDDGAINGADIPSFVDAFLAG
jgi:hypothetical protein